jgi:hypothetical protein
MIIFVALIVAACGGSEPPATAGREAAEQTAPASESKDAVTTFAFTASDLDAYARGIAKEIELVKAAQERASVATTPQERGAAIEAQWEDTTVPEAARLAGIDAERYRATREAVHEVFKTLDFQGKIDGPLSIDLSRVDEATRTRIARDPFSDLSPESAVALRAKMNDLVPLWSEYMTMTAVAG